MASFKNFHTSGWPQKLVVSHFMWTAILRRDFKSVQSHIKTVHFALGFNDALVRILNPLDKV